MRDVITYNAWNSACEKGALLQRALELFAPMLRLVLLPDVITNSANLQRVTACRDTCSASPPAVPNSACAQCLRKGSAAAENSFLARGPVPTIGVLPNPLPFW